MQETVKNPKIKDACHAPNRLADLQSLSDGLEKCQKSLNDYLDSKRNAFPRQVETKNYVITSGSISKKLSFYNQNFGRYIYYLATAFEYSFSGCDVKSLIFISQIFLHFRRRVA